MRHLPILLFAVACKPPPEAPSELDELAAYIYTHHADEDPAAEEDALEKLSAWLEENWADAEEGYEIGALDEATMDSLDDVDRATEGMLGLAVPTASVHTVDEAAYAMLAVLQSEVYPDMFVEYQREEIGDVDCFLAHDCERVEARENMKSDFVFVESVSQAFNQYLWVDLDDGVAFVQRNWLEYPPDVTGTLAGYVEVDEQGYLNLFMPRLEGFWRLQATWMIFSQDGVPEDAAMQMAISNMQNNSKTLDEYLDTLTLDPSESGCASAPARPGSALGWLLLVVAGLVGLGRRR